MPRSRTRKSSSARPKRKPDPYPVYKDKETFRLKPKAFNGMRENEDFITFLRMGRILNTLSYSGFLLINSPTDDPMLLKRHRIRTLLIAGGYVAEGLQVVESLRLKYARDEYFVPLLPFFTDVHKQNVKIVREIRNSVAFHLDYDDKITKSVLKELKLPYYELVSAKQDEVATMYFNLVDLIDLNYLITKLDLGLSERESMETIFNGVLALNKALVSAINDFMTGLLVRLKIAAG